MKRKWMLLLVASLGLALVPAGSALAGTMTLYLNNNPSQDLLCSAGSGECPSIEGMDPDKTYWHFVATPNHEGDAEVDFTAFYLNLNNGLPLVEITSFFDNGTQTDNVFVPVPVGYTWDDLYKGNATPTDTRSYATYSSGVGDKFVLSHVCVPTPEPSTLLLLGSGLLGVGLMRRRRN